jgi:YbgC/YbaW family acyl-CoA thioester hydrolase
MAVQDVVRASVAAPLTCKVRVRYGECDPQGVVFNAHFLAYFDIAITELFRAAFGTLGDYQAMADRGVEFVVAEAGLRYHRPAHFDDELTLETAITRLERRASPPAIGSCATESCWSRGRSATSWLSWRGWSSAKRTQRPRSQIGCGSGSPPTLAEPAVPASANLTGHTAGASIVLSRYSPSSSDIRPLVSCAKWFDLRSAGSIGLDLQRIWAARCDGGRTASSARCRGTRSYNLAYGHANDPSAGEFLRAAVC